MTYSLNAAGHLVRDEDGACIPADPANTDYANYLAWVEAGNTATPYAPPEPTWTDFQAAAKVALAATSVTIERIHEGVSLGTTTLTAPDVVTFMQYRRALRAIVTAETGAPGNLPVKPPYPQGT
jgi:hypothetical protein